ncbi:MAG: LysR family transcriptional regulator [Agathobacter sp.]|uniref:LysR family transcriptional regulator n=1 Tax=Agathobacter sp. TaxID=2021311 RepID=UPI00257E5556|nr:LysR family transcriptional regulator [Agathobacter sp.]MBQ1682425.1 LysR family transcriptional regulator [Agathobacter sp.]
MTQNLSSYYIFYTVAKAGNISRAAKELFISQPAISKSIQKLEDSLNCKLFTRSSRGVLLTYEGQILYDHVRSAFTSLNEGELKLRESIDLGLGKIKIGVSSTLCKYILLPYLEEFVHENPHINISIQCQSTNETLKLLDESQIDIGLIGKPSANRNLIFDSIEEIEDIFVANGDYLKNLKMRNINDDEILSHANLILLDSNNMTRQYIDNYLKEQDIEVSESIEISSLDLVIEFAKIGLGVSAVIKQFVADELKNHSLVEIPLAAPMYKREVGFAYKPTKTPTKALSSFIRFYKEKGILK